jgi:two-component system sensor kinase FixL
MPGMATTALLAVMLALGLAIGVVAAIVWRRRRPGFLLAAVQAAVPEAMVSFDAAGRVHAINSRAGRLFGHDPGGFGGRNITHLLPALGGGGPSLAAALPETIGLTAQMAGCRRDGSRFAAQVAIGAIGVGGQRLYVGLVRELGQIGRDEKSLAAWHADLFHAIRLSEMGHAAAGLAHELAQPLAAISHYARAGQVHRADLAADQQLFERIGLQARRAADIVKRLRGFLAKRAPKRQREDLGEIVDEAVSLALPGKTDRRLRIVRSLDPEGRAIYADRVQILQVLVNLLRNAADATKGLPARRILIASRLDEEDTLCLSIADNGHGLPADLDDRAFEAFETTKPDGMGLGLAISKMIIEDHGGRIWHARNEYGGATFFFTLKRADAGADRFDQPEKKHA